MSEFSGINLTGPTDFGGRIFNHFFPMGNPAWHASDRKHHREHIQRNTNRAVNNSAVKIDIGLKFAFDKIRILQRDFF